METLDRETILAALKSLNQHLEQQDVMGEICIYGDGSMVLAFHARLSTHDLDAVFQPVALIREAAAKVASEMSLRENWINDGVKGWLSPHAEFTSEQLPQFGHLRLLRPTGKYLLAMKCLAARSAGFETQGDKADILFLARALGLRTSEAVLKIVEEFYEERLIQPKTRFLIEETMSEIATTDSNP